MSDLEYYYITFNNKDSTFGIKIERMFNGHIGCYEDDFKAFFKNGKKRFDFSCYLFTGSEFKITAENVGDSEFDRVEKIFVNALDLK